MKKKLLSLALALVLCLGLTVPAMAAETDFTEVIPCELPGGLFEHVEFHEGLACTRRFTSDDGEESKFGFIDKTGEVVIPCIYDLVTTTSGIFESLVYANFSEGVAAMRLDGKWGYIDKTGEVVIPFQYEAATDFSGGLAGVVMDGLAGYINKEGEVVIPCQYEAAGVFSEGIGAVMVDGRWQFIDEKGEAISSSKYSDAYPFSEGLAAVCANKWGFIDKTGATIVPLQYDDVDSFSDGLAMVMKNEKYGFIDKTGKEVIPCQYESVGYFSSGLAPVLKDDEWSYIDKTGEVAISCDYLRVGSFSEGFASVTKYDEKSDGLGCGYIDTTGKEVVPPVLAPTEAPGRYVRAYAVSDGMAEVVHIKKLEGSGDEVGFYGYIAFPSVEEETPAPVEPETPEEVTVSAKVSDWAKEQVDSAASSGLIAEGLGEDYRVNITRAQFAAVAVKLYEAMSGEAAPAAGDSPFTDTSDPAVIQAEALGVVGGVGDGKFDPASLVTREQAAVMLSRVYTKLGGELPAVDATNFADDDAVSGYARDAVAFMADKEIVGGVGDNKFAPQGSASIEQALVIALRMYENLK